MLVLGNSDLAKEICDSLGLKNVKTLDIHLGVDDIVEIKAVFYPEIDGIKQFPAILKKYHLTDNIEDTTVIGDKSRTYTYNITACDAMSFTEALKKNTSFRQILKDGLK